MEKQIDNFETGKEIDSEDHRVVQSIAMLALSANKKVNFSFPECVSKSWPQFWKFWELMKDYKKSV